MKKSELIEAIAKKTGATKTDTEKFMNGFIDSIKEALLQGEEVKLIGLGTFSACDKPATTCKNPSNPKEVIEIPARKVVKFKLSKKFRDLFIDEK